MSRFTLALLIILLAILAHGFIPGVLPIGWTISVGVVVMIALNSKASLTFALLVATYTGLLVDILSGGLLGLHALMLQALTLVYRFIDSQNFWPETWVGHTFLLVISVTAVLSIETAIYRAGFGLGFYYNLLPIILLSLAALPLVQVSIKHILRLKRL